jgi:hypothetical protein
MLTRFCPATPLLPRPQQKEVENLWLSRPPPTQLDHAGSSASPLMLYILHTPKKLPYPSSTTNGTRGPRKLLLRVIRLQQPRSAVTVWSMYNIVIRPRPSLHSGSEGQVSRPHQTPLRQHPRQRHLLAPRLPRPRPRPARRRTPPALHRRPLAHAPRSQLPRAVGRDRRQATTSPRVRTGARAVFEIDARISISSIGRDTSVPHTYQAARSGPLEKTNTHKC